MSFFKRLKEAKEGLEGSFFPVLCVGCRRRIQGDDAGLTLEDWLCERCERAIYPLKAPFCETCGEPYWGARLESFRCGNCEGRSFSFDFARAGYVARGRLLDLIHHFKYSRRLYLANLLGGMALKAFEDARLRSLLPEKPLLVPVPLHPARLRWRGYNQSLVLAEVMSRELRLDIVEAVSRLTPSAPQADLTRAQRLSNLRGSFAIEPDFCRLMHQRGSTSIILVDDVFTTGATTHECARVLRSVEGVEKVVVVTVARG